MPQLDGPFTQNCVARALYDNIAESPDELSFRKGDILTVLEQNTADLEGWWLCSLRGRQGICPGNRLRLLAGVYDIGQKVIGENWNSPVDVSTLQQQGKRRSWHVQPNKVVTPQKVGDVYLYDFPVGKGQIDYRYDVPSAGSPVPVLELNQFHSPQNSHNSSRPESGSGSSGYGAECYDTLKNSQSSELNRYDTPRWPPQRCRNSSESYDFPRPVNTSIGSSVSPSSSISSLATSNTDSVSSSNRSSIAPDYDVPRSRPVPFVQLHLQKLEECQIEASDISLQPKQLSLELNSAIENLERLENEITTAISKLLSYAGPYWREKEKLGPKLMDIKLAALRFKSSLRDLSDFSEGVLGNALNAADKGLAQKIRPLVKTLLETNSLVQESCKELDCCDWSLDMLMKSKDSPNFGESNYTLDGLDQLILCARSLTEDVRQFASFVQGNSILLFKKTIAVQNSNSKPTLDNSNGEYVNLESHKTLKKEHNDIREILPTEMQKSHNFLIRETECDSYSNGKTQDNGLEYNDKQVLIFYATQCATYTLHLTHAIDAFLNTVEHNQPPKVFLAHGKFVILSAHRLVHIGDTISRNVQCDEVNSKVLAISNSLSETLAATVHKIKKAALQFPTVTAVQEMVDSVVDVSHIARDLKLYIIFSSQL